MDNFVMSEEHKKLLADLKAKHPGVEIYPLCAGELDPKGVPTARASVVFNREPTFPECQLFMDEATDDKSKGKSAISLFELCLLHPASKDAIKRPGHVVALANRFIKVAGITDEVTQGK
jgi:hypothetical protein